MKKAFLAILAVLYLSTSIGATIHFHYCMGKLAGWDIGNKPSKRCAKCGMNINPQSVNKGCCNDEFKQIKNDKDQKLSVSELVLLQPVGILSSNFQLDLLSIIAASVSETYPVSNAPPGSPGAIYIRNCVFLI